jgi:hypothetical protein
MAQKKFTLSYSLGFVTMDNMWTISLGGMPNSIIQSTDSTYVVTGAEAGKVFLLKLGSPLSVLRNNRTLEIETFSLMQNYPNPFNPITTIEFDLPKTSEVRLKIFNILGEELATLVSDRLSAGSYSYEWDASNLASGVYLYRLQAGDYVETRKMVLMR